MKSEVMKDKKTYRNKLPDRADKHIPGA